MPVKCAVDGCNYVFDDKTIAELHVDGFDDNDIMCPECSAKALAEFSKHLKQEGDEAEAQEACDHYHTHNE